MQVFLPENSFDACARVLDNKRLNKQLLEGRQIMSALAGLTDGWINHPAVRMFDGAAGVLLCYLEQIKNELKNRKIKWEINWYAIQAAYQEFQGDKQMEYPLWMTNQEKFKKVVCTHRANLYLKDPVHYKQYSEELETYRDEVCCYRCKYYWPSHRPVF